MDYLNEAIELCKPAKVTVITDSAEDLNYVKELALRNGEEFKLAMKGHTVHFDGIYDQGRDKRNTRYLVKEQEDWGIDVNTMLQPEGVAEVREILDGIMEGKEMLVAFFCLGPTNSPFSMRAMQITDSAYVVHSETILYRPGYEEFKRLQGSDDFFYFLPPPELNEGKTVNIDKRRIYIDLTENRVYRQQPTGNSVGLKLAPPCHSKANREDWLAEHMFLMVFTASLEGYILCRRLSHAANQHAMLPGQTIVGDDIAYLNINGRLKAVNVEKGIFELYRMLIK